MTAPRRLGRRALLAGSLGAVSAYALGIEPAWLDVGTHDIAVPGLSRALAGYRIAQLTDLHLTRLGRLHDAVLSALRAQAPQLVVITGDAIDDAVRLPVLAELCREIAAAARCPLLATLGNWEHWGGVGREALDQAYARAGARLLGDESMLLDAGLVVIATDDACSGHAQPEIALRAVPRAEARLFLSHAPGLFDDLPLRAPRFHLGLAGHTHGGQITALGKAVWVPPGSGRFTAGLYATAKGPLYVSRGLGTSVIPARLAARPELPVFRLVQG